MLRLLTRVEPSDHHNIIPANHLLRLHKPQQHVTNWADYFYQKLDRVCGQHKNILCGQQPKTNTFQLCKWMLRSLPLHILHLALSDLLGRNNHGAMDIFYFMKLMPHMQLHTYLLHLQEFIFLGNRFPPPVIECIAFP